MNIATAASWAGRLLCTALVAMLVAFAAAAPARAQSIETGDAVCQERDGARYIAGEWRVTGRYKDETSDNVNFTVNIASDGTFVDQDNYAGRWMISGANFTMYYPDESQLAYVGQINGDTISGNFEGLSVAGSFRMRRTTN